jgi:hypothetical protein
VRCKHSLKTITLIVAAVTWTSPDFAAEISNVRPHKKVVAAPAKAHQSSWLPVNPLKIASNTCPLILGIGF